MRALRSARFRVVLVNLMAVAVAVMMFFGYRRFQGRYLDQFDPVVWSEPHPVVGNLTRPNQTLHWSRTVGFDNIFDITVSTNAHGFRVTPSAPTATKSLLFFGCSYTFGVGVEDRESYPFLVGEALGGSVATYNISFTGWGPHEMLAALQSGLVERMVKDPPVLAVFLTIPDHVRRVIGREEQEWMVRSPRFVLEKGVVVRNGTFGDDPQRKPVSIRDPGYWLSFEPTDYALYGAVVAAARDEVLQRFPGTRFEVVLWDTDHNPMRAPVLDALRTHQIYPSVSDDFLVDDAAGPFRYMIAKQERHPNPEGLRLLARFVETEFLNRK